MFFSSKSVVGIDIGSSSIKLAEISITKKGFFLDNFAVISTPQRSIANGEISDPVLISESIKTCFRENGFKNKNACVGLSGTSVIVKKITIPKVDSKQLKEQIRYEASQYLPFDISQVTITHHVLGLQSDPNSLDVIVVAAQNEFILNYMGSVVQANLKCSILDVSSLALANIFEVNYGKSTEPVAIFNFGSNMTTLVVLLQGEIIFTRDIPVGGFHFTNEISKNMGITFEEAETLKISQTSSAEVPEESRAFMNLALDYVTEEIRNSIDFYTATMQGLTISKIYYTGGAALTAGMIEHLMDVLKISFEPMNTFMNVHNNNNKFSNNYLNQISPFAAVACGLALRKVGEK